MMRRIHLGILFCLFFSANAVFAQNKDGEKLRNIIININVKEDDKDQMPINNAIIYLSSTNKEVCLFSKTNINGVCFLKIDSIKANEELAIQIEPPGLREMKQTIKIENDTINLNVLFNCDRVQFEKTDIIIGKTITHIIWCPRMQLKEPYWNSICDHPKTPNFQSGRTYDYEDLKHSPY